MNISRVICSSDLRCSPPSVADGTAEEAAEPGGTSSGIGDSSTAFGPAVMWRPSSGARGTATALRDRNLRSRKYGSDTAWDKAVTGPTTGPALLMPNPRTV
ncbi:hypothetical protein GCM10009864_70250 [Streptomyces lunalinharesii]|uniref:Uncharacterized protein n=1 Tax=Streptomyces lunalinharesii TaxID=333384 RepID=A0ABP6F8N0_9ACTN